MEELIYFDNLIRIKNRFKHYLVLSEKLKFTFSPTEIASARDVATLSCDVTVFPTDARV